MPSYQFRWDIIPNNFDFLMSGLEMTLIISATALVFAMLGGLLLAVVDMSRFFAVRAIGIAFGELIRNTPILVQLLWVYYVLPIVFGLRITSLAALLIGLSVYMAAFISEVYRSGIQAVPKGQKEAAQVPAPGDTADAAATGLELRPADQVLVARLRHLCHRDHAARHGAFCFDLPAPGDLLLYRGGLFLHLLAARDGDPRLGAPPCETLISPPTCRRESLPRSARAGTISLRWPDGSSPLPPLTRRAT